MYGGYINSRLPVEPNLEIHPTEEVNQAMDQTALQLMSSPEHTYLAGRRFGERGFSYFWSGGAYEDEETGKIVETKIGWLRKGWLGKMLAGGVRPINIKSFSVAVIDQVDTGESVRFGEYRLFTLAPWISRLSTCVYDNYDADFLITQSRGETPQIMLETVREAESAGLTRMTPALQQMLGRLLVQGNEHGWDPLVDPGVARL